MVGARGGLLVLALQVLHGLLPILEALVDFLLVGGAAFFEATLLDQSCFEALVGPQESGVLGHLGGVGVDLLLELGQFAVGGGGVDPTLVVATFPWRGVALRLLRILLGLLGLVEVRAEVLHALAVLVEFAHLGPVFGGHLLDLLEIHLVRLVLESGFVRLLLQGLGVETCGLGRLLGLRQCVVGDVAGLLGLDHRLVGGGSSLLVLVVVGRQGHDADDQGCQGQEPQQTEQQTEALPGLGGGRGAATTTATTACAIVVGLLLLVVLVLLVLGAGGSVHVGVVGVFGFLLRIVGFLLRSCHGTSSLALP